MVIYTDQMFNLSGAAVTTLTAMNFGTGATAGPYSPQLNGKLVKLTFILVPQAATSLAQHGRVELTQTNWKPNTIRFPIAGFGIATAPQVYGGDQATVDYVVDLPVQTDWPITGQVVYPGTGPVTPTMLVMGTFTA
jgi:hypothetical protein